MKMARIIPCLDIKGGRIVKGVRFRNLRDAGDPAIQAAIYEHSGADEIVILDVSATVEERSAALDTVRAVRRELSIPLTVGGGVRTPAGARALLESGADKVSVNTAGVERPELIDEISSLFGHQCTVLAIDAASRTDGSSGWEVVTRGGQNRTGIDAIEWARECERRGAGEILLTSWDRDGTRSGYDLVLLRAVTAAVRIPVIASGGADTPEHLAQALDAGADAVLAASIFHDAERSVDDVKRALRKLNVEVRL